ncbi:MAG: OPT family oligopeptide transporter [Vulcanimicrobiota bacterium]
MKETTPPLEAPEDPEVVWLREVYVPNEPQLTVRAVIGGMAIGAIMCLSNLYVFFKTGWSLGVTLTACILAFAIFKALGALGQKPLSALENNALTTVASGAGYMTGGGNMAAFGALLMITTLRPDPASMVLWFGVIAALGVFVAIPIKRQLVNKEALAFPTGTATAETIRSLHAEGEGADGTRKAKALGFAALFGAVVAFLRDVKAPWMPLNLPGALEFPFQIAGRAAREWTISFKTEVVLLGAGALMSFRTGWSLLLGGLLTYGFLAPSLVERGLIDTVDYKTIIGWTLWPAAGILVSSGLTAFLLDGKSIVRSFSSLSRIWKSGGSEDKDPLEEVEAPASWFVGGILLLTPIIVFLMSHLFAIPIWAGLVAVPLAIIMGFVAARVTGETDITPTKALGPVTQALYGVMTPGNMSGNIMSANVTGGIGLHAADLLTTLKTGWLLGAKPRIQLYAQLFGVVAGAACVVPAFNLLIPDPSVLGGEDWPAPACLVWAGVSEAFAHGLDALEPSARSAFLVGGLLGAALALMEKFVPRQLRTFVPSASGLGIAMVIPGGNAIAMFLGSSIAEFLRRSYKKIAERYVVPVASGLIAGESLMGIVLAILLVAGFLPK